jgi:hypothetical protein
MGAIPPEHPHHWSSHKVSQVNYTDFRTVLNSLNLFGAEVIVNVIHG